MEQTETPLKKAAYTHIIIIGFIAIFIVLRELQDIFVPLVVAYFLFFIFSPLNNRLQKLKFPLWTVIFIDIFITLLILGGISMVFVGTFSHFSAQLPGYADKLSNIVSNTASSIGIKDKTLENFRLKEFLLTLDIKPVAGALFTSGFSFFGNLALITFFYIFIVTGHQIFYNAFKKRFSEEDKSFSRTYKEVVEQVNGYFITKIITSAANAIIEGTIIWLWGVEFAPVWALIIFIMNFIPNIGSVIALTLPCLMALVQFESVSSALMLGLILLVIDQILGSIVEPQVFGESLGLNPLIILLSLLVWGYIWGITGALLSVPLTAIFKIMVSKSDSPNMKFLDNMMSSR